VSCYGVRFDGDERQLIEFSTSKNVHRRHLNESQRAMHAAEIANLPLGANQHGEGRTIVPPSLGISNQDAADLLNISTGSVKRGRRIRRDGAPELVQAVEAGEVTLHAALGLVDLDHDEQRERLPQVKKSKPAARHAGGAARGLTVSSAAQARPPARTCRRRRPAGR
jgi:hypothetical protein